MNEPKKKRPNRAASTNECDYCDSFTPDLYEGDYAKRLINHIKIHCFPISSGKITPATKHFTKLKKLQEAIGNKTKTEAEAVIWRFRRIRITDSLSSIGNDNSLNQGEFKVVISLCDRMIARVIGSDFVF